MAFLSTMRNETRDTLLTAAAYVALFLVVALIVGFFGVRLLGLLIVVVVVAYLALKKTEYALWLTVAAMFFPIDFEGALGLTFQVTPTRLFGGLLVFAVFLNYRKYDWGRLKQGGGIFFGAVALLLWGAVTLLLNDGSTIGSYISEVLPSIIIMMMIILIIDTRALIGRLIMVITVKLRSG